MRGNAKHEQDMKDNGIKMIDLVVLNLYAFEDTVAKGYNFETCIENIDIGGPSMRVLPPRTTPPWSSAPLPLSTLL